MRSPSFHICEYGIFDSSITYPKIVATQGRGVSRYEIKYYPNSCQGLTYIDGKEYTLPEGTVTCAKPGQFIRSRFPRRCHYMHIQTDDLALIKLLNQIPEYFVPGKVPELEQIFNDILMVEVTDDAHAPLLLNACVCKMISLLIELKNINVGLQYNIGMRQQKLLQNVEQYIQEHLKEELSLASIAAYCSLSPAYFHRLFTAYFQKTPTQYLLEKRICAARAMLLGSDCSPSKVAEECGFASQAYFCSKFKQATGFTPLQYRKQLQDSPKVPDAGQAPSSCDENTCLLREGRQMQPLGFEVPLFGIFNSYSTFPDMLISPDRVTESYEIEFYPNACQGRIYFGDREYALPEGTVICAKPGQLVHDQFPSRCEYVHIQTDDPTLMKLLDQIPECFVPGKAPGLVQIFNQIMNIDPVDNIQNRLLLASCVYRLIVFLVKLHGVDARLRTGIDSKHQQLLLDAEKYIKEHLKEDLSLSTLCAHCGLSRSYFHLLFTTYFEKTPVEYILERRIRAAKKMLLQNEHPISVVAEECGFATQAYFCSKFKQVTGLTPLQYRREMLSCMNI